MSDRVTDKLDHLFRSAVLLFVASFVGNFMGMAVRIVLAQSFPSVTFGRIMTGYTAFIFVGTIGTWGLNTGLAYYLPRHDGEERHRQLIGTAVGFGLLVTILFATVGYQFRESIAVLLFNDADLAPFLGPFLFAVPAYAAFHILVGVFRGYERTRTKVLVKDLGFNGLEVLLVGLFIAVGFSATLIGGAYVVSTTMSVLFALLILSRRHSPGEMVDALRPVRNRLADSRMLLSYSSPVVLTAVAMWGADYFDTFLLQSMQGATSVAYYKAVYPMAVALKLFTGMFTFIYLPSASDLDDRDDTEGLRSLYALSTAASFVLALPVALSLILLPDSIIGIFYPPEYVVAALALQVLVATFFFESVVGVNRASLNALGRTRSNLSITVFALALNLSLNVIWIPVYGILGAALATLVSFVTWNLVTSTWLYYSEGLHPFEPFYLKAAAGAFAFSAVAAGAFTLLLDVADVGTHPAVFLAILAAIAVIGYVNLRILLVFVPADMREGIGIFDVVEDPIGALREHL